MSLQVWLPLNGDLHNLGLSNIIMTNNGATIDNSGKIGRCYYFNGNNYLLASSLSGVLSICFWVKLEKKSTLLVVFVDYKSKLAFGFNASNLIIVSCVDKSIKMYSDINFPNNIWTHIALVYNTDNSDILLYINGILLTTRLATNYWVHKTDNLIIGARNNNSIASYLNGYINDFRMYDYRLTSKEVEEIAKGLILHLPLNEKNFHYTSKSNNNLLLCSGFTATDYTNMTVSSSSTDWTKYLRWYNGSKSIHSFAGDTDTVTLNNTGNLGICFVRKATDINLDPNSYYTLSCEAKCTKSGALLSIATSYRTTGNAWTWRGGANKVAFTATNAWQTFTLTFKPDADTQYICYCFTCADGVSGGTDTFSIRHCKLEKGSIATPWDLNPSESLYGITNGVFYDISGYKNNGIVIDNVNFTENSPVYNTYTKLVTASSHILIDNLNVTGFTDSYSISWWGNVSAYSGKMMWGFADGCRLNGIYSGNLWNTGDGSQNPLYNPGTTTLVSVPTTNTWHHFVMVGNGTKCLVYKDGVLWGEAKTYKSLSGTTIYMNGWLNNASYTLANTMLCDFRIYATALSADLIKELYNTSMVVSGSTIKPRDLE